MHASACARMYKHREIFPYSAYVPKAPGTCSFSGGMGADPSSQQSFLLPCHKCIAGAANCWDKGPEPIIPLLLASVGEAQDPVQSGAKADNHLVVRVELFG